MSFPEPASLAIMDLAEDAFRENFGQASIMYGLAKCPVASENLGNAERFRPFA